MRINKDALEATVDIFEKTTDLLVKDVKISEEISVRQGKWLIVLCVIVSTLMVSQVYTLIQLNNLEKRMNLMEDDQTIMLNNVKRATDMMIDWSMQHSK